MTHPPWRYRSPCCDSCNWTRRTTTQSYVCRHCGEPFARLADKKTDARVSGTEVSP